MYEVWNYGSLAVYIVGYVVCWRKLAYYFPRELDFNANQLVAWSRISTEDIIVGLVIASALSFFWPVFMAVKIVKAVPGFSMNKLAPPPRAIRDKAEYEEQQRRIRELEREIESLDHQEKLREQEERWRKIRSRKLR